MQVRFGDRASIARNLRAMAELSIELEYLKQGFGRMTDSEKEQAEGGVDALARVTIADPDFAAVMRGKKDTFVRESVRLQPKQPALSLVDVFQTAIDGEEDRFHRRQRRVRHGRPRREQAYEYTEMPHDALKQMMQTLAFHTKEFGKTSLKPNITALGKAIESVLTRPS